MRHRRRSPALLITLALGLLFSGGGYAAGAPSSAASVGPEDASSLPALPFGRILRYDEMTSLLRAWAKARPGIVQMESLGTTPGGRHLWFLTLTNTSTGPASEKPALLVDGNMHALEWTGGVAALNFVQRLVRGYGADERVTRLLDTRAVYVMPRVSPDGVEATLTEGRIVRSAVPPGPGRGPAPGFRMRDIDGDGQIVFMRFRDTNGPWKAHPAEPRLLVPRTPEEPGGPDAWRVVPEGVIEDYDGATIAVPPALEGIDFGMFFPDDRGTPPPPGRPQPPTEISAYVDAIVRRPNIVAHVTCHTFGGGILMPPVNPDEDMPLADRQAFEAFAGRGKELTTYDPITYLGLRAGRDLGVHIPTEIGWLYNVRGIFSFITEFWNPLRAAGVELEGQMSTWLGGLHPIEDEVKLLRWSDRSSEAGALSPGIPSTTPSSARSRSAAGTRSVTGTTARSTGWRRRSLLTPTGSSISGSPRPGSRLARSPPSRRAKAGGASGWSSRTRAGCRRAARRSPPTRSLSGTSRPSSPCREARTSSPESPAGPWASSPAGACSAPLQHGGAMNRGRRTARSSIGWSPLPPGPSSR